MSLWMHWWGMIWRLRPAFSRLKTFLWFAIAVAGFAVRTDMLGVTSIVRALNLDARCYNACRLLPQLRRETRPAHRAVDPGGAAAIPPSRSASTAGVLVGDGIKIPKCSRKMPAVKLLHQQSEANTKPEYITGHSLQAVSLLVQAASSFFAVPLAVRIHEDWCGPIAIAAPCSTKCSLLGIAAVEQPFYFVADATIPPTRSSPACQAEQPPAHPDEVQRRRLYRLPAARGRATRPPPGLWQEDQAQLPVANLSDFQPAPSPVYGENKVIIQYRVRDLLWRPAGRLVRFVAVIHPTRGSCLLMCWVLPLTPSISFVSTACASRSSTPSSRQYARSVPSLTISGCPT